MSTRPSLNWLRVAAWPDFPELQELFSSMSLDGLNCSLRLDTLSLRLGLDIGRQSYLVVFSFICMQLGVCCEFVRQQTELVTAARAAPPSQPYFTRRLVGD